MKALLLTRLFLLSATLALLVYPASGQGQVFGSEPAISADSAYYTVGAWTWHPVPAMRCREGGHTGYGVRRTTSDRVLLLLPGGGACFDKMTCSGTPLAWGLAEFLDFLNLRDGRGLLDETNDKNPMLGANVVVIGYCTGDVFIGTNAAGQVDGHAPQAFLGRANMSIALDSLAGEMKHARHVLFAGLSAGGFGVQGLYDMVQERLAPAVVDMLSDSGPLPASTDVLTEWTRDRWRTLYKPVLNDNERIDEVARRLALQNRGRRFMITSSAEDRVIRSFFGKSDDCTSKCDTDAALFSAALRAIGDTLPDNAGVYVRPGTSHTAILSERLYQDNGDGRGTLADWVRRSIWGRMESVD